MAITYFGYCASDGTPTGSTSMNLNDEIWWTNVVDGGYSCPGSGDQAIKDIGVYCNGTGGNVRLGVYSTSGDLIVETSEKATGSGTHWTSWNDTELTWHVGTALSGGTNYFLSITTDASTNIYGGTGRPSGTIKYASGDYTAGMPDPLPAGSNYTIEPDLRCGVEPAAGGAANYIPAIMHFARMRND